MNWIPASAGMTSNTYYMDVILADRQQKVLYDKKWFKFLRRARLFRHIPFVEFAFGAGSMAVGNVTPRSDFDVIIGARQGRIFTARFLAVAAFGIFGWRRKRLDHSEAAQDKICLNHFVTERTFCLTGPHTDSWRNLYLNLVPVYGVPERINDFWAANGGWMGRTHLGNSFGCDTGQFSRFARSEAEDVSHLDTSRPKRQRERENWPYPEGFLRFSSPAALRLSQCAPVGTSPSASLAERRKSLRTQPEGVSEMGSRKEWGDDLRHRYRSPARFKLLAEFLLGGIAGDILEAFLKYVQVARIERSLRAAPLGYKPRIIYNDFELEFHPDRAKFEVVGNM